MHFDILLVYFNRRFPTDREDLETVVLRAECVKHLFKFFLKLSE